MTIDAMIRDENLQYDVNNDAAKSKNISIIIRQNW